MFDTPYFWPSQVERARRRAWQESATDPSMPEGWADFVGSNNEGLSVGQIGSLATGALGIAGNAIGMSQQRLGLGPSPDSQFSSTGEPIYNLGAAYNEASSASPTGATGGEILGGVGQGAVAGSALGPVGAAVGGVIGGVASLIGGGARKRAQERERERAMRRLQNRQKDFNTNKLAFDKAQTIDADYRRRQDITDQLYNLYRY